MALRVLTLLLVVLSPAVSHARHYRVTGAFKKIHHGRWRGYFHASGSVSIAVPSPARLVLKLGAPAPGLRVRVEANAGIALLRADPRPKSYFITMPNGPEQMHLTAPGPFYFKIRRGRRRPRPGEQPVVFQAPLPSPAGPAPRPPAAQPAAPRPTKPPVPMIVQPTPRPRPVARPRPRQQTRASSHETASATSTAAAHRDEPASRPATAPSVPAGKTPTLTRRSEAKDRTDGRHGASGLGLRCGLQAGAAWTSQDYGAEAGAFQLALQASYRILKGLDVAVGYASSFHDEVYWSRNPNLESRQPQKVTVSEQAWDVTADVGFDVLQNKWYELLPFMGLEVRLGPKFFILGNDVFGAWGGGFRLGSRIWVDLGPSLRLSAWAGWLKMFFGSDAPNTITGSVNELADYGLGLDLPLPGRWPFRSWSLQISFVGQSLIFDKGARHSLGAALGLNANL